MDRQQMNWVSCGVLILTGILALAPLARAQNDSGGQENPAALLKTAKELIQAHKLTQAEEICNRLLDKGGTLAAEAQELKQKILAQRTCEQDYTSVLSLISYHECPQARDVRQKMQQLCPDYAGLDILDRTLLSRCPAPQRPPELDAGIELFHKGDYRRAQKVFEALQPAHPDLPELQTYLQKTEVELLVENYKASLKRGDAGLAHEQFNKLTESAPDDPRIPKLRAQLPSLSPPKDQGKDRATANEALLDDAIHEYYAGHFSQADQLLDQFLGQPSRHKSLAYFYRGAIACTDYFLTGAKDEQKQSVARDFFSKAHQADGKFAPPRDYISPKIIEVYEKTAAGS